MSGSRSFSLWTERASRKHLSESAATVGESRQFRAWVPVAEETESEFRAQMAWPGDDRRFVTLHVSAFHTPRSVEDHTVLSQEGGAE